MADLDDLDVTTDFMRFMDLLGNLRNSLKFWFLAGRSAENVHISCVEILMHGLDIRQSSENGLTSNQQQADSYDIQLKKFIDEFEWIRRSTMIKDIAYEEYPSNTILMSTPTTTSLCNTTSIARFLHKWILRNYEEKTLCASVQAIVAEQELLQNYYHKSAFLRNEAYTTAFIIGLSAFELNQCSLLSQIDENLYLYTSSFKTNSGGGDGISTEPRTKHKRTSSHPNFSVNVPILKKSTDEVDGGAKNLKTHSKPPIKPKSKKPVLSSLRKTKSLPLLPHVYLEEDTLSVYRPRSKTLNPTRRCSKPRPIPNTINKYNDMRYSTPAQSNSSSYNSEENAQEVLVLPSTSAASHHSRLSSSTTNSSNTNNTSSTTTSNSPASSSIGNIATHSNTQQCRRIELINCDDIKIWTDQSEQLSSGGTCSSSPQVNLPPSPVPIKKTKSISPMNSFLSSIFGTPPSYSTWYTGDLQKSDDERSASPAALNKANENHQNPMQQNLGNTSCGGGGGVFDAFMPIYGTKLQSRQKSNIFEDSISTLDYSIGNSSRYSNDVSYTANNTTLESTAMEALAPPPRIVPKNCQSLTDFLHMQMSRNNTELEKENAHFRISEAIISAIEHIKYAKSQPDRHRRKDETVTATDWLESERGSMKTEDNNAAAPKEETIYADSNEYIPYAELGETCFDTLSAEVVGLSLISRFNDKHLPKVSELKWLVSDEDTPQQLLPMPSSSSDSNPSCSNAEHLLPPLTRGTKYWAPPRQQIIFTDHPTLNRRQVIHKQNNRCAGCGMHVSAQFISSFRYCTYFGRYHCTGCHRNQMSVIPAKILHFWDFKCYPVSVFAYRLLEQIYTYPLFHVPDLNPALYIKWKALLTARHKRFQLKFIKDFIRACRFATREQNYFITIPDYIANDPDTWSISDFIDAYNERLQRTIDELIEKCENHIFHCVLCTGRGFCCEYCLRDRVIYPWEKKVFRCDRCGSCFHMNCWKAMLEICCRCRRMQNRQNEIVETVTVK